MRPRYSDIQISLRPGDEKPTPPPKKKPVTTTVLVPGKVGKDHPDTSHVAAKNITSGAASHRSQIIEILGDHPDGLTCYEVAQVTGRPPNQEATRMLELREMGLVEYVFDAHGKTVKRPTTPGNRGQVQRLKRPRRLVRIGETNGNQKEGTIRR